MTKELPVKKLGADMDKDQPAKPRVAYVQTNIFSEPKDRTVDTNGFYEYIFVVEKSAHDAALARIAELESDHKDDLLEIHDRNEEMHKLKEQLAAVTESLEANRTARSVFKDECNQLRVEVERLKSHIKMLTLGEDTPDLGVYPNALADERDRLTEQLKVAVEALVRYSELPEVSYIATEALEQIGVKG
jgi:septal ring factor EnvC (AmiA/AmiB activator)